LKAAQVIIEKLLLKYNDSTERSSLNLILFSSVRKLIMKIARVITLSNGHLYLIALKGSALSMIQQLASFSANTQFVKHELFPNYAVEEWR
jgi:hypothetical protein